MDDEYRPYKGLDPTEFQDCCERIYNTEISIKQEPLYEPEQKMNTKSIFLDEITDTTMNEKEIEKEIDVSNLIIKSAS